MKSKFIKIVSIMLICVSLVLFVLFILFNYKIININKGTKKDNEEKTDKLKDIKTSEEIVKVLMDSLHLYDCERNDKTFFTDKNVDSSNINQDLISYTMLSKLSVDENKLKEGSTFTKKEVKTAISELYSKDFKYDYGDINSSCLNIKYDKSSEAYTVVKNTCNNSCEVINLKKVVKAKRSNKEVQLYVRVIFSALKDDDLNDYKDYGRKKSIDLKLEYDLNSGNAIEDEIDEKTFNKGSLYKITFVDEKDRFLLSSVELVNE